MPSFFKSLKFMWEYFVRNQHRAAPLPDFSYPPVDKRLMSFLIDMYRAHGTEAFRKDNWVIVGNGTVITRATCLNLQQHPGNIVVQVDIVTLCDVGKHIIESFAGVGADEKLAIQDACKGFQDSSFHALFSALLGSPCSHCEVESWTIDGIRRRVTMGRLRMRGHFPLDDWSAHFAAMQKQLEAHNLSSGLHWVRIFYCYVPASAPTIEVLIDNNPQEDLQTAFGGLPWPQTEEFYSVRLFMIIQDEQKNNTMG